ncbi:MAG: hypothetical protein ACI9VN_002618, partial [Patescibacteria group bacterium]
NTNTNYNSKAEELFGNEAQGMFEIASFLGRQLEELLGKERLKNCA